MDREWWMRGKRVLIIDDDADLRTIAGLAFARAGAEVYTATDGREGLGQFYICQTDLVVLDIMMPILDGWETCRHLRRISDVPIIFVTVLNREEEIVRGLDCGALDYVTKTFSPQVLLARARAALRRGAVASVSEQPTPYQDGYLTVDLARRRVFVDGESVQLTATEYRLLAYLLENAGRVLTYRQILEQVWGWEYRDCVDYVHVYVCRLRQKLERNPGSPVYLLTERGVGYRFESQDHWPQGQVA
jgi:two-component system KDP operon response regulator KdpE